jgi:hypothetical protein
MALLVPNWNPSDKYTGPLQMLCWLFRAPSVSSHSTRPRAVTKCQVEKALIGDRDFTSQVSRLLVPRTSGSRNAKWPGARSFGISHFTKSGCKGYPCSLGSPVTEKPKYPVPIPFRDFAFHEIRMQGISLHLRIPVAEKPKWFGAYSFWDFAFREIKMQGDVPAPWSPGCQSEMPKRRNVPVSCSISGFHNNDQDARSILLLGVFTISQFAEIERQNASVFPPGVPKSRNHNGPFL